MYTEIRLVVSFYTTCGAMAFMKLCEERGIEGHMVPIPQGLKAGCGQVWSAPLSERARIVALLEDPQVEYCDRTLWQF